MAKIHNNKVAIITGARSGLGLAISKELLSQGAKITMVARSQEKLEESAEELKKIYKDAQILPLAGDVTDDGDAQMIVDKTVEKFGTIDYLVNCAGIEGPNSKITDYDMKDYRKVIEINLNGTMNMTNRVGKIMVKNGYGSIVNVSSTAGHMAVPNLVGYTASKHGVIGLTRQTAIELAKDGIRCNSVSPGGTATDMLQGYIEQEAKKAGISPQEMESKITVSVPMGRFGKPEEQAYVMSFLLSDYASYITGENITVDGGQTAKLPS